VFRQVPISGLHEDPANARKHPDRNRATVRASLQEFGQVEALVVEKGTGRVIGGNCRLGELRALGVEEVMVAEVDLHGIDATRLGLVLNRSAETAEWDADGLAGLLKGLDEEDALAGLGWDDAELEALLADVEPAIEPSDSDDDAPEPDSGPPDSQPGEVYELGPHRLVCGDCTDALVWEALLGKERPALVLTDPPYGVGLDYSQHDDTESALRHLAAEWLPLAVAHSDLVVFSPGLKQSWFYPEPTWALCWFYGGGQFHSPWGFNCWQPILCYGKDPSLATGNGCRPDAVNMNVPANAAELNHPCPKPVKLWVWMLERCSFGKRDTVADPFAGSGTTLIACALTGRVARCIELDPRYCDVIRRRWFRFAMEHKIDPGPGALE